MSTSEKRSDVKMSHIDSLICQIESHPQLKQLVATAKQESDIGIGNKKEQSEDTSEIKNNNNNKKNIWTYLRRVIDFFVVKPEDLVADTKISGLSYKTAEVTAGVTTTSNWIDCLGNAPVFYYAFSFFPGFGFIGVALSGLVLKFSNEISIAAAGGKWGGLIWSKFAISGLLLINVVQSTATMVGVELFNNQPGLAREHAKELLESVRDRKSFNETSANLDKREICDPYLEEYERLRPDPEKFVAAQENFVQYQSCLDDPREFLVDNESKELGELYIRGDYFTALEKYAPIELYANFVDFDRLPSLTNSALASESGEISPSAPEKIYDADFKNGFDAVQRANKSSLEKVTALINAIQLGGNLQEPSASLGFSPFILSISLITSASSCLLLISFSLIRQEGGRLRSSLGIKERARRLNLLWEELMIQQKFYMDTLEDSEEIEQASKAHKFEQVLFNLFRDAAERTGDYDYLIPNFEESKDLENDP